MTQLLRYRQNGARAMIGGAGAVAADPRRRTLNE
jgi:hypothetical protein